MTGRRDKGGKGLSPSTLALRKGLFLKELTWANICSFLRTTCYFNKTKISDNVQSMMKTSENNTKKGEITE